MASGFVDFVTAFRLIQLFLQSWDKTEAFKVGIVDKDGKWLVSEKDMTIKQKKAYTPLVRFAFNLRKFLNKLPGGKLGGALAVLQSLRKPMQFKESYETTFELINVSSMILENKILGEDDGGGGEPSGDNITKTGNVENPTLPMKKMKFTRKELEELEKDMKDVEDYLIHRGK